MNKLKQKGGRSIKVIESYIEGKLSEESCEDELFLSEYFVGVIDGVTSKSDFQYKGKSSGKLAAEIVRDTLQNLSEDAEVMQFVKAVNEKICSFYEQVTFPYSRKQQGLQAVCAVYSNRRREIWMIGDCQVRVDGVDYTNPKYSDNVLAEMRCLVLNIICEENRDLFLHSQTQQMARDLIEPWILRSNVFANRGETAYGYSVLNGEDIPSELIRCIKLDDCNHEIILASDGYPKIMDTLQESELQLQKILQEDPVCYKMYHSTKGVKEGFHSFDDRTYIRFAIEKRKDK